MRLCGISDYLTVFSSAFDVLLAIKTVTCRFDQKTFCDQCMGDYWTFCPG